MKTIREWLKEFLSKEDYNKAVKYENEDWEDKTYTFKSALYFAFDWDKTKQGDDYWREIYQNGGSLKTDPIVQAVCEDLMNRSSVGIKKYGTTLKDADLSDKELLQHAYEEALDLANYLKTLITKHNESKN